jgi:cbb3-type cytochrome oxidase maturation protein
MNVIVFLIPVSIGLGLGGLVAFFWSIRARQYDDIDGSAQRILAPDWDDRPRPPG